MVGGGCYHRTLQGLAERNIDYDSTGGAYYLVSCPYRLHVVFAVSLLDTTRDCHFQGEARCLPPAK